MGYLKKVWDKPTEHKLFIILMYLIWPIIFVICFTLAIITFFTGIGLVVFTMIWVFYVHAAHMMMIRLFMEA